MADPRAIDRAESFSRRQAGMLSHAQAQSVGVTTSQLRTLMRRGRWVRVTRGVYRTLVRTMLDPWDEKRQRAGWTGLLAVPGSTAVGVAALALQRAEGLPQHVTPEVCTPHGRSITGPAGVVVRRYRDPIPADRIRGFLVATVPVAIRQALPGLTVLEGVTVLDSALHTGRLSERDLAHLTESVRDRRGAERVREQIRLADGRAESPLETRARLCFREAGLPPARLQVTIGDRHGEIIARGDMGWKRPDGSWVIVEMDGREAHGTPSAVYADRGRQNEMMLNRTITILRFTNRDLDDGYAVRTIREALNSTARVA